MEPQWETRIYESLRLHVRVKKLSPAAVAYEVRDVHVDEGVLDFEHKDNACGSTSEVENAAILMSGTIKFDGCSDNRFGNGGYIHGCFREHLTRLGPLYDHLYDWAIELIGNEEFLSKSWT